MDLRVGLDFDNTLIDYDAVFTAEGRRGLIAVGKGELRPPPSPPVAKVCG